MIKKLNKTNISLLIIALCAIICCGLFALNNFIAKKLPTVYAEETSATLRMSGTPNKWYNLLDYNIKNLTITNQNMPENYINDPVDVSEEQNGLLKAYQIDIGSTEIYDCIIYGDVQKIYAPADSGHMFASHISVNNGEPEYNNLYYIETINFVNFDTSKVTNMNSMFRALPYLKSLDLTDWNTNKVTSMAYMFELCTSLETLDISSFITGKLSSNLFMFGDCSSLKSVNVAGIDVSAITELSYLFYGCTSLESIIGIENWNTANVTHTRNMFENCSSLLELNLSNWNTSKFQYIDNMFYNCSSLTSLDISNFDTNNVEYMQNMFYNCSSLKTIYGLDGFNTSKVTDMQMMFAGCASLDVLDLSSFDFSSISSDDYLLGILGLNDDYVIALLQSYGSATASLLTAYQQAIANNSVDERVAVISLALQNLYSQDEESANAMAEIMLNTNIQTIYAPTSLNSRNICLPFNNNAQYVYNDGTSEVETSFLVGRDTAEELAIYVKGENPLAKPEASAPSVTPETGFVDEQLLPALAVGLISIVAVALVASKKKKYNI